MDSLRGWLWLALAAVIVALAAGWYLDARGHSERVEALHDSIDGAQARVDSFQALKAARDSAWRRDSARWHRRFDSLAAVAREAEEQAEEAGEDFELVGDSLRSTLELIAERFPEAQPLVDTAMAQVDRRDAHHELQVDRKDVVIRSLRKTLRGKDTLIAKLRGRVANRDSIIAAHERKDRKQEELIAELESQLQVTLLDRIFRDPVVKAALAGGFYLLGRTQK